MEDIKKIQQERTDLYKNLYDNKIPKRVPIEISFAWEAAMSYANLNLREAYWDQNNYVTFMDKVCSDFQSDKQPIGTNLRRIGYYHYMGSRAYIMSNTGAIQHPEVHALEPEEYDEFIEDPYKCMVEKLLPRLNPAIAPGNMEGAIHFAKAYKSFNDSAQYAISAGKIMKEKYGYADIPVAGSFYSPFDFLADLVRSFTGVVIDMRRRPEKVEAACEALLPICLCTVLNENPQPYSRVFMPLHMAPFMKRKDFERFWWPPFLKMVNAIFDCGLGLDAFVENDWMDKLDYLESLDSRVNYHFEFGDPALVKDKLHGKHIISGMYPVTNLSTMPKEKCINELKKMMDILSPDGSYIFNFDKLIFSLNDNIANNLKAVLDTVSEYGVY
ncbi:MAG: uroporphyrinogen decarboxylase family protein [Eubacteriales bacterium]